MATKSKNVRPPRTASADDHARVNSYAQMLAELLVADVKAAKNSAASPQAPHPSQEKSSTG